MKRLIVLFAICTMAVSCTDLQPVPRAFNDLKNDITYADSLNNLLDSNTIWSTFNKVKPYYLYLSTTEFDSSLAQVYIKDLTWLDRYQRALGKWGTKYRMHTVQLSDALIRLDNLSHDIQYGILDSATANTYTTQERSVVQNMIDEINTRGGEILYYANGVDSMQARLDSIFPNL